MYNHSSITSASGTWEQAPGSGSRCPSTSQSRPSRERASVSIRPSPPMFGG